MLKELVVLSLMVFLLSTVESNKPIKKVLSIVKDIKNEMVTVDEIVDALTPIIEGSCSCCDEKPQCQAILIVSGSNTINSAINSVQALDHDGYYLCDLPDIPSPYERFGATMDGHILCGGIDNSNLARNCICYNMGSWINPQDILNEERWHASSWGRPYPNSNVVESHIFGGEYSLNTSEIANCVDSTSSYNYNDGNAGQCTIQFDDHVIITGGWYGFSKKVVVYKHDGHLKDLKPLVHGRGFHGCGHYIDNDGNMVYLVTGGVVNDGGNEVDTVTTERSINEGEWSTVLTGDLPTPRHALRGVSLNNNVFMTGGWEWGTTFDAVGEVLQWDIYFNEWIKISDITPRYFHSVSVLPCDEVKNYCTTTTKKNSFPKTEYVGIENADGSV